MALDGVDRRILRLVEANGKIAYQEIGEAVGLSAAAAFQRVRRLEAAGFITGYHARVDAAAVGRPLLAFIEVESDGPLDQAQFKRWLRTPAMLECHRLSGLDRFLLKVRCESHADLVALVDALRKAGCRTRTHMALETQFERWAVA
ncbi:MAG TPA: Lrp/AsnC family transcriptional regulator [Gemmatimonadales bacterium]|nr:Lrp/AsnC family transcriptional regulator [Gemmatimonadales bacterium]